MVEAPWAWRPRCKLTSTERDTPTASMPPWRKNSASSAATTAFWSTRRHVALLEQHAPLARVGGEDLARAVAQLGDQLGAEARRSRRRAARGWRRRRRPRGRRRCAAATTSGDAASAASAAGGRGAGGERRPAGRWAGRTAAPRRKARRDYSHGSRRGPGMTDRSLPFPPPPPIAAPVRRSQPKPAPGGCGTPLLVGCGVLAILLGLGAIVFVVKAKSLLAYTMEKLRGAGGRGRCPRRSTAPERERLAAAFAARGRARARRRDRPGPAPGDAGASWWRRRRRRRAETLTEADVAALTDGARGGSAARGRARPRPARRRSRRRPPRRRPEPRRDGPLPPRLALRAPGRPARGHPPARRGRRARRRASRCCSASPARARPSRSPR